VDEKGVYEDYGGKTIEFITEEITSNFLGRRYQVYAVIEVQVKEDAEPANKDKQ
jgi:hypothetical protein